MLVYLVFSCIHSSISIWPGLVPTEFTELIYILAGCVCGGVTSKWLEWCHTVHTCSALPLQLSCWVCSI